MDTRGPNTKLIVGFLAGAIIAGGGAYMAAKSASPSYPVNPPPAGANDRAAALQQLTATPPPPGQRAPDMPPYQPAPGGVVGSAANGSGIATPGSPAPVNLAGNGTIPPNALTVPAGTAIPVRLEETISTEKQVTGDSFTATLASPVVVNGVVIAQRGASAGGRLTDITRSGKVKGLAHAALRLTYLTGPGGQRIPIQTSLYQQTASASKIKDVEKVGIGAGIGALIGGLAGGGKGAAIGAGAGGGAGEGVALMTRGKPVVLPVETRIDFRLASPITVGPRYQ